MIGAVGRSLGLRIVILAALNLALLLAIGMAASGVRVPRGPGQMLMQMSAERISDVSRQVALDLQRTSRDSADALLARYTNTYQASFVVALNDGTRLAGAPIELPASVISGISGPPGDGRRGRPEDEGREGPRPPPPPGPRFGPPPGPGLGPRLPGTPPFLMIDPAGVRYWIGVRMPIQFAGDTGITPGTLLIASPTLIQPLLLPERWIGWGLLALAATLLCWWPLLSGLTRSLRQMERATERIAEGRFDTSLGINRRDEIGRLSRSIEQMSSRLGSLLTGQKRFLGDTAHELRSPLGRMQVALEILDSRVPAAQRAYVTDLKEDVVALSRLTDELLQYAKTELAGPSIALAPVNVSEVAGRVVSREAVPGTTINVHVPADLTVQADAALFERALANVVRNAVRYAGDAGPIEVTAEATGNHVVVSVLDVGPGVPAEAVERIFDPFYREDAARNRKTGGVGLGLAIVRSAIDACGGSARCRIRQPHGLEVRLTLRA